MGEQAMSNLTTILAIMALAFPHMFIYVLQDKWMQDRRDAVATGMVGDVRVSAKHRRLQLLYSWGGAVTAGVGFHLMMFIGWMMVASVASSEQAELLAYLFAFFTSVGVMNWIVQSPFWYSHLASVLRQAEAE
jgi:hypothetical protein